MEPSTDFRTIAELWANYERRLIPPAAGATQRMETRRAFYGGALAALSLLSRFTDADFDPALGLEGVNQLQADVDDFFNRIGADR